MALCIHARAEHRNRDVKRPLLLKCVCVCALYLSLFLVRGHQISIRNAHKDASLPLRCMQYVCGKNEQEWFQNCKWALYSDRRYILCSAIGLNKQEIIPNYWLLLSSHWWVNNVDGFFNKMQQGQYYGQWDSEYVEFIVLLSTLIWCRILLAKYIDKNTIWFRQTLINIYTQKVVFEMTSTFTLFAME